MEMTGEQLLDVFAAYNQQVWPMQVVAYLLGVMGLVMAVWKNSLSNRVVPAVLAFFWLWVAFMFWLPAGQQGFSLGYLFVVLFFIEGVLFLVYVLMPQLSFEYQQNSLGLVGIFFGLYALLGYPLVSTLIGHAYPRMPPFGLTPCPVVAYTFGMLLLTTRKVPKFLLVIPFFYAVSGFLWMSKGLWEDAGMVLSGLLGVWLIWRRDAQASFKARNEETLSHPAAWSLDIQDKHLSE
jgi:hypothetical protein